MSNVYALKVPVADGSKYVQIIDYLSQDEGYWIDNDVWDVRASGFNNMNVNLNDRIGKTLDFSGFVDISLKNEVKYYVLVSLKNKDISVTSYFNTFRSALKYLAQYTSRHKKAKSFSGIEIANSQRELFLRNNGIESEKSFRTYSTFWNGVISFITGHYDEREETEKDIWYAANLPGAKRNAVEKSGHKQRLNFKEIPVCYRKMVKRFYRRLITKRSWSYCCELLIYIKYFFGIFYENGYTDGFFEKLSREDIEKYLLWLADYHKNNNATYRSKAVSFIRNFIDYIQLAEYEQAPKKDVNRLIFDDDFPRRERVADTFGKVKYIPAPVIEQLDAAVNEIEPEEFIPVYILLRESGWRGSDVLNLRYDNCIDYQWNAKSGKYVGYLCGEITKTGIPLLKIPIRDEVAEMVNKLAGAASEASTNENNPDKYLFNVYEGKKKGLPINKTHFVDAVRELIKKKGIRDADGKLFHFKTHSLRHTRAMEYAEQGMPIEIIQQLLGHCSLQMTIHYAKTSENALYEKWNEIEKLGLFHIGNVANDKSHADNGSVRYEKVRANLDAVRVPFGECFKPTKVSCKQQMKHCLTCSNFCSTKENIPELENEIKRVKELVDVSVSLGRMVWVEKNREYLKELEAVLQRIQTEEIVHKSGNLREVR